MTISNKKTIEEKYHYETLFDQKTGEPYQKKIIDQKKQSLYYFNKDWLNEFDLMEEFYSDIAGDTTIIRVFVYDNTHETHDIFVCSEKYHFTNLDFGNIDIKFQKLYFEEITILNKVLDGFKKDFEKWGCINLEKVRNVYTVVNNVR